MILVRPEGLDLAWARNNLVRVWCAQAPKRVLKEFDVSTTRTAEREGSPRLLRAKKGNVSGK